MDLSPMNAFEAGVNMQTVLNTAVKTLYKNGNNTRNEKGGKSDTLITFFMAKYAESKPVVFGIWPKLPRDIIDAINSRTETREQLHACYDILSRIPDSYNSTYVCYIPKKYRDAMCDNKDSKLLNIRSIFPDQERQKWGK
jgi:hypothetical protein